MVAVSSQRQGYQPDGGADEDHLARTLPNPAAPTHEPGPVLRDQPVQRIHHGGPRQIGPHQVDRRYGKEGQLYAGLQ